MRKKKRTILDISINYNISTKHILTTVLESKVEEEMRGGRKRLKLMDDVKIKYKRTKKEATDGSSWRQQWQEDLPAGRT